MSIFPPIAISTITNIKKGNPMTQIPVGERIIVKPDPVEEITKGGIVLADTAKEKSIIGTVISIGDEKRFKFQLKPGQRVRFSQYAGTEIQNKGEEPLLVMREDEIYTIIK